MPTASAGDAPICTDRPTKSNFACTVPKGLVQIEADGFTWLNNTAGGNRTNQLLFSNPTVKYGLTDSSDIQLNWVPFTRVRTGDVRGLGYIGATRRLVGMRGPEANSVAYRPPRPVPPKLAPEETYEFAWSHGVILMSEVTVTVNAPHVRLCQCRSRGPMQIAATEKLIPLDLHRVMAKGLPN